MILEKGDRMGREREGKERAGKERQGKERQGKGENRYWSTCDGVFLEHVCMYVC